jgi:hypothetical protein
MKNITRWAAAAAVLAIFGACTTEVTDNGPDGGVTSTTSGAAGSSTSAGGSGGSGTGGAGGSSDDGGGTCAPSADPSPCELCAFAHCKDETCACEGVSDCKAARPAYFTCLAGLDGGDMEGCASTFISAAPMGTAEANDLTTCMGDTCVDVCAGKDGGPRPRR